MHTTIVIPAATDLVLNKEPLEIFCQDVVRGLTATPKYLESKYFYDATGDRLFQQIMQCQEYYLTNCEMEIMTEQAADIAAAITSRIRAPFDLIELGPGDATKSIHLLEQLLKAGTDYTYYPIDISANVISSWKRNCRQNYPASSSMASTGIILICCNKPPRSAAVLKRCC